MMKIFAFLFVAFLSSATALTDAAKADKVLTLPGSENLDTTNYGFSGYIDINGSEPNSKHMHYWMIESTSPTAATDPVVLWTNGGPGCSGLLGMLSEQGPWWPTKDGKLATNQYAWNNNANMIFIEQPCGVGFSYSTAADTKEDYTYDDDQAAADMFSVVEGFMERFPELSENDFYLTSESYGGHYLPTLAKYIVDYGSGENTALNGKFRGFMVGNPATDKYSTTPAMIDTWYGHQLVSKPLYDEYQTKCSDPKDEVKNAQDCEMMMLHMFEMVDGLNSYALDYGVCVDDSSTSKRKVQSAQAKKLLHHNMKSDLSDTTLAKLGLASADGSQQPAYDPCIDNYLIDYLNRDDVKKALNVNADIKWGECSYSVHYSVTDKTLKNSAPYYTYLMENNHKFDLDILVISGDDDSVCGTIGTQSWIYDLGFNTKKGKDWKEWKIGGQMAGFLTQFTGQGKRFAFATVHNAGHEVPTYQPEAALGLFQGFLSKSVFADSSEDKPDFKPKTNVK